MRVYFVIGLAVSLLPIIGSAAPQLPPEAPPPGPIVIELNAQGEIVRAGKPPIGPEGMKTHLGAEFALRKRDAEKRRVTVETKIMIRVAREAPFRAVVAAMDAAKSVGFADVSLEAKDR